MKAIALASFVLTAVASPAWGTPAPPPAHLDPLVGTKVAQFSAKLIDPARPDAEPKTFDSHGSERATVYLVVGTRCPATQHFGERFAELEKGFIGEPVDFIYVYANREDSREDKLAFHRDKKLGGRLIDAGAGEVAGKLGARRTSEIFVTDSKGVIQFHGPVDDSRSPETSDQKFAAPALEAVLAGKPVPISSARVFA